MPGVPATSPSGAPVDVMEIDAASNTGVDDIRTLRENVQVRAGAQPLQGLHRRRGAHAVQERVQRVPEDAGGTAAPRRVHPRHDGAAADPPATVLSRCQRFDFQPDPARASSFRPCRPILTEEQIQFDPSALPMLVRAAEGSLRDALSLHGYGHRLRRGPAGRGERGHACSGRRRRSRCARSCRPCSRATGRPRSRPSTGPPEPARIWRRSRRDAVELLRRLLVVKVAPRPRRSPTSPRPRSAELARQAEGVSTDELIYLLRAFVDADGGDAPLAPSARRAGGRRGARRAPSGAAGSSTLCSPSWRRR